MLVDDEPYRLEVQLLFAPSHRGLENMEDPGLEIEPSSIPLPDPGFDGEEHSVAWLIEILPLEKVSVRADLPSSSLDRLRDSYDPTGMGARASRRSPA